MAFLSNRIGFFLSFCLTTSATGRCGAIAAFGLSLIKWILIVRFPTYFPGYFDGQYRLWWVFWGFRLFPVSQRIYQLWCQKLSLTCFVYLCLHGLFSSLFPATQHLDPISICNIMTNVLAIGRGRTWGVAAWEGVAGFEDGGRGLKPRSASNL